MRKLAFYARLAMQNLFKNRLFYGPNLLACTLCAALFYIFQTLQEKIKPIEFENDRADVDTEIRQYTNPYVAGALQDQIEKTSK